jgi:hypothetical protein
MIISHISDQSRVERMGFNVIACSKNELDNIRRILSDKQFSELQVLDFAIGFKKETAVEIRKYFAPNDRVLLRFPRYIVSS